MSWWKSRPVEYYLQTGLPEELEPVKDHYAYVLGTFKVFETGRLKSINSGAYFSMDSTLRVQGLFSFCPMLDGEDRVGDRQGPGVLWTPKGYQSLSVQPIHPVSGDRIELWRFENIVIDVGTLEKHLHDLADRDNLTKRQRRILQLRDPVLQRDYSSLERSDLYRL